MPQYQSPGVYVEEVPSAVQPIAGVGTSTAGFIGIVADTIVVPKVNPFYDERNPPDTPIDVGDYVLVIVDGVGAGQMKKNFGVEEGLID